MDREAQGWSCLLRGLLFSRNELLATVPDLTRPGHNARPLPELRPPLCWSVSLLSGRCVGPGLCQRLGGSGRGKDFQIQSYSGQVTSLPKGLFPHLYPQVNEPDVLSGPFGF